MNAIVWYKVRHPWFDPEWAYRAVAFTLPSESAWAYLTFILNTGHTVSVQVHRCTALPNTERDSTNTAFHRRMWEHERSLPWATKPKTANPDLDLDMQ